MFVSGDDTVNPRELKRLINTYVLQMKMLAPRLAGALDSNVVLALLCLGVRPDWRELYDQLAADPLLFQKNLRAAFSDLEPEPPTSVWMPGVKVALPQEVVDYINGPGAPLLSTPHLVAYVSAVESTSSSDPSILEAQSLLSRIRKAVEELPTSDDPGLPSQIQQDLSRMLQITRRKRNNDLKLPTYIEAVSDAIGRLARLAEDGNREPAMFDISLTKEVVESVSAPIEELDRRLRELRRKANIGVSA